ncbi:hypothetical protein D3C75_690500 [compost metagenome]
MRRGNRAQEAGIGIKTADFYAAANAVVVIVVRAWNQFWRAGAAAGKLEESHFVSRRWGGDKVLFRLADQCAQRTFAIVFIKQYRHAQRGILLAQRIKEIIVGEQIVFAIGNHHRRFNLAGIRFHFSALMAEQRVHRSHANFQQRKQRDVQLSHVAQLHQRGFAITQTASF